MDIARNHGVNADTYILHMVGQAMKTLIQK